MKSLFCPTVQAATKTPNPAYPVIKTIETGFDRAVLTIDIPANDEAGHPLPSLNHLDVYCSEIPFVDNIEALLGLAPAVTVPLTLEQAGQEVAVTVPDLKPGTNYHFSATVDT